MQSKPLIPLLFLGALGLSGCEDPEALMEETVELEDIELLDEQDDDIDPDDVLWADSEIQDEDPGSGAQGPDSLSVPPPEPLESGWAYSYSTTNTSHGNGTWGSILRLKAIVSGNKIDSNSVRFRIQKKDGSKFTTNGTVSLRRGGSNGTVVLSAPIYAGEISRDFLLDLNYINNWNPGTYISFYGRVTNKSGYAWAGKIRVTKGTYP